MVTQPYGFVIIKIILFCFAENIGQQRHHSYAQYRDPRNSKSAIGPLQRCFCTFFMTRRQSFERNKWRDESYRHQNVGSISKVLRCLCSRPNKRINDYDVNKNSSFNRRKRNLSTDNVKTTKCPCNDDVFSNKYTNTILIPKYTCDRLSCKSRIPMDKIKPIISKAKDSHNSVSGCMCHQDEPKQKHKVKSTSQLISECLCSSIQNKQSFDPEKKGKVHSRKNSKTPNECTAHNCKYINPSQLQRKHVENESSQTFQQLKFGNIIHKCLCVFKKSRVDSLERKQNKQDIRRQRNSEKNAEILRKEYIELKSKGKHGAGDADMARSKHDRAFRGIKSKNNKIRPKNPNELPESQVDLIMPYSRKKFHKHISHTKLVKRHSLKNMLSTDRSKKCFCCLCENKSMVTKKETVNPRKKDIGVDTVEIENSAKKDNKIIRKQKSAKNKTKEKSLKKIRNSKKKRRKNDEKGINPADPSFKIVVDSNQMCVLNTEEVNTALSTEISKQPVQIRDHEKSCQCCVCQKKRKNKLVHSIPKTVPGQSRLSKKNKKGKTKCVCGSKICKEVYEHNKNRKLGQKFNHICDCYVEGSFFKNIFKKKKTKQNYWTARQRKRIEKHKRKLEIKRLDHQRKQDALRKKRRKKDDKYNLKMLRKYQQLSDKMLLTESILDATRLGGEVVAGLGRTSYRLALHPKTCCKVCRNAKDDPEDFINQVKNTIADSSFPGTVKRIRQRTQSMRMVQAFMKRIEGHPIGNFIIHAFDKNPKSRLTMKRKGKQREVLDYGCNLFMGSLRRRPLLWVYYSCGWFYPHCLSILNIGRQVMDVCLFVLAVLVWSPCIIGMELCRAAMCCTVCTG